METTQHFKIICKLTYNKVH